MKRVINVTIVLIIVMLASVFAGEKYLDSKTPELLQQQVLFQQEESGIIGQGEAMIGELVRLEVQGELVEWDCLPSTDDLQEYGENKQNCVVTFRKAGTYNVIAAVYSNSKVRILHQPITVEGVKTPAPSPEPVVVIPDYDDVELDDKLIDDVQKWCRRSLANKSRVSDLATVFQMVALEIKSGELTNSSGIFSRTSELTSEIDLSGMNNLMAKIQGYITKKSDAGELEDIPDHLTVWISIAEGLSKYVSK